MKPALRLQMGDYRITLFNLGRFALDGGAMFGVVPRTLWSRLTPPDEQNRIALALNCLLIEFGDEKIFVDAGVGTKFDEKYRKIYAIEQETGPQGETPVDLALASVGLGSEDITQVLFTHLHFDHAGGATRQLPDGRVVPTFQNARYVIHRGEWEYGICPHERCKASYLKENLQPVQDAGRLVLLDGDRTDILPGLSLHVTGGHTPYHQLLVLDQPDGGLIYWGDLLPTRHHVRIPYVMGYDEYPVETMARKKEWLARAARNGWVSVFEHDPELPACTLEATGEPDVYEIRPLSACLLEV